MKLILNIGLSVLAFTGSSVHSIAQTRTPGKDSFTTARNLSAIFNNAEIHLQKVKKGPEFPGGKMEWQDYLRKNINLSVPFSNRPAPGIYKTMIRFIVGYNGKLRDIGADTNCGFGMEAEVIRCVHKSPDWLPAETNSGEKVSFTLRQVVTFNVKLDNIELSFK